MNQILHPFASSAQTAQPIPEIEIPRSHANSDHSATGPTPDNCNNCSVIPTLSPILAIRTYDLLVCLHQ